MKSFVVIPTYKNDPPARHPSDRRYRLLVPVKVYPELTEKYALKIGGENRPDWLQLRHWEHLSDELSLKKRFVLDTIQRMAGMIVIEAEKMAEALRRGQDVQAIIEKIVALIRKRAGSMG
jgi:serine/threonine-protein kinase HipA